MWVQRLAEELAALAAVGGEEARRDEEEVEE
jgi:hypothetical protein